MTDKHMLCFVTAGTPERAPSLIDLVVEGDDGVQRGRFSAKSQADLAEGYPGVEVWPYDDYVAKATEFMRTPPKEIDAAEFIYLRDCLPPEGWVRRADDESFKLSEYMSLDVTAICARVGEQYFKMYDVADLPHEDIIEAIARSGLLRAAEPGEQDELASPTV